MSMRDAGDPLISSSRRLAAAGRRDRPVRAQSPTANAQTAFTQVARAIIGRGSAQDVAQVVVNEARRLVPADRSAVWLWQPERGAMRLLAVAADDDAFGEAAFSLPIDTILPLNDGSVRNALEYAHSVRDADLCQNPQQIEQRLAASGLRSRLTVPVLVDERPIGVLAVSSCERAVYALEHQHLLESLAVHLAVGLEQARLTDEVRRQRCGAEEVMRAAAEIAAETDHERRMQLTVEHAVTIVGGVAGSLCLVDPPSGRVVVRAAHGHPTDFRGRIVEFPNGITERVLASRQPVLMDDDAGGGSPFHDLDGHVCGPVIGVPVRARGEALGSLVIQAAAGAARFQPEDITLLQAMADLAAAAVDNARAREREAEHCRRLDAVRGVTAELARELDVPSLLDLILFRTTELVQCESSMVMLWDEASQHLVPKAWCGMDDEQIVAMRLRLTEGIAGAAAFQRRGVVVEDSRHLPANLPPTHEEDIPISLMATPMLYQDRLIGVLTANRLPRADGQPAEPFTARDLELLDLFGGQAAVAVENARLFEQATAAKALRELAQLKAELLNTVSHELRTPLSLIHGYAELLLHRAERLSPAEVAQMSGEIYTSSRTLARLVDDLLDFSQMDRRRPQLRRSAVALNELLEGMVRTFRERPGSERIQTALEPALLVDADPDRLRQVVGNLLTNALDYTMAGPITVRAARLGEVIQVDVSDEGPGLSAEDMVRVWESFYRGAQAAQLPNRGSGLGLSVVKQLVELHGGSVGARSVPGSGATFWFTLPPA